jgi:hypothetical protein
VARGFESKDVEFQQSEAERSRQAARSVVRQPTAAERQALSDRRSLELALARARADFDKAVVPAHRRMLECAISDLELRLTLR